VGSACHLKGSYDVISILQEMIKEKKLQDKVTVKAALCLNKCTQAVSLKVDQEEVISVSKDTIRSVFEKLIAEKLGNE
jgi:NADH:ubiquinone oxidoreductase subunit E